MADLASFERLFGPPVLQVRLDWARLRAGDPRVVSSIVAPSDVLPWFAPWYVSDEGIDVPYDAVGARPLTFAALRDDPGSISAARRERIARIAAALAAAPAPLLVASYRAGTNELVLDGNHRLAAAVLHDLPLPVLALTVVGPADPSVLPDLVHFRE